MTVDTAINAFAFALALVIMVRGIVYMMGDSE